ncbi:hypothetical protein ACOME3_009517 [Neoechinorhynchus agilis]
MDYSVESIPPVYIPIEENEWIVSKRIGLVHCEFAGKCSCTITKDIESGRKVGCGISCINRSIGVECPDDCDCGKYCTNRRMQTGSKVKLEIIKTEMKGWGVRTLNKISCDEFIVEYVGQVVTKKEAECRSALLRAIDPANFNPYIGEQLAWASKLVSTCDPNSRADVWTINGTDRIGMFANRDIEEGEEITYNYLFTAKNIDGLLTCRCGAPECVKTFCSKKDLAKLEAFSIKKKYSRPKFQCIRMRTASLVKKLLQSSTVEERTEALYHINEASRRTPKYKFW